MSACTKSEWDGRFEENLREFLPFLPAGQLLTESSSLRALGLDSVGTVELLAKIETDYDVRFRNETLSLATFATPGALWAAIRRTAL